MTNLSDYFSFRNHKKFLMSIIFALLLLFVATTLIPYFLLKQPQTRDSVSQFLRTVLPQTTNLLPYSSSDKKKIKILQQTKSEVLWRDGMYVYKKEAGSSQSVLPYALNGKVKDTSDRYFEVVSPDNRKAEFLLQPSVKVRLLETAIAWSTSFLGDGQQKLSPTVQISYQDIKKGQTIQFFELEKEGDHLTSNRVIAF